MLWKEIFEKSLGGMSIYDNIPWDGMIERASEYIEALEDAMIDNTLVEEAVVAKFATGGWGSLDILFDDLCMILEYYDDYDIDWYDEYQSIRDYIQIMENNLSIRDRHRTFF